MKTTYAWLIALAVLVLGGAWYLSTTSTDSEYTAATPPTTVTPGVTTPTPTPAKTATPTTKAPKVTVPSLLTGYSSLNYLVGLKDPYVCTIKAAAPSRTGTVYVAGGKMRGDFKSMLSGLPVSISMIADGTSLYVWKVGASSGLKLPSALSASGSTIASNGGLDPATDITYSCAPWVVQPPMFSAPPNVSF